jgi:nicotinate-nucleotide adenylyltransferase
MVGLFFGSFNPIHIGHLVLANYLLVYTELTEIWFVVSPHNPLKDKKTLLDDRQRLHMVNLAIEGHHGFKASDIEFKLAQPSYTINTLVHLETKYPKKQFALIMGADSISSIGKWKNTEQILQYPIFVYPREGYGMPSDLIQNKNIHLTEAPIVEISSTMIRKGIKEKKDLSYFMHPKVAEYIEEMGFYKK